MEEQRSDRRLRAVKIALDARYVRRRGMGFHRYVSEAIKLLVEEGASVTLLTNFPTSPYVSSYPNVQWASFGSSHNIIWEQLQLPFFLRHRDFDLYWAPANDGIPIFPIPRTWTVSTTHDVIPLQLPRMYLLSRPWFALPYLLWTFSAILRSDTLITVSECSAEDIHRHFRRQPIVVPPLLSDANLGAKGTPLPDNLLNRSYIVYNGGIDLRKNVRNLLKAFAIVARQDPATDLLLMGDGFEGYALAMKELGIEDRVIITGYVAEDMKTAILASASVLVYPSLYEGFGLPILEAFAVGLPVVSCNNSALAEVAGDAAVYVDPHDPESIAEGLIEARKADVAARLRENGTARLTLYRPEHARQALIDEFQKGIIALARRSMH
ncbi:MAG: glycosyltransferase family 1 protein [Acidimicrobiales bacterium]